MITKGNRKFKDYDGDKLTSVVNMTHNTSIKNSVDNIDEILASIVYGKTEQNHPQPVYKKHISIQVPPFEMTTTTDDTPIPDIGSAIPPIQPGFNKQGIDPPITETINSSTKCISGATHYETLGVDENSTIEQIRNAYRIKSRLCHPDKRPGDIYAVIQQSEINNAKDILIDVEKRKQYDKYLHDKKRNSKRRNRKT